MWNQAWAQRPVYAMNGACTPALGLGTPERVSAPRLRPRMARWKSASWSYLQHRMLRPLTITAKIPDVCGGRLLNSRRSLVEGLAVAESRQVRLA